LSAILVGCAFAALAGLLLRPIVEKPCSIAKDGVWTNARVVEVYPRQHQTVAYEFVLKGRTYAGIGAGRDLDVPFSSLAAGDTVEVSYLRTDPGVSVLGNAVEICSQERGMFIVGVMFVLVGTCAMMLARGALGTRGWRSGRIG
jgi:hypothetical protein